MVCRYKYYPRDVTRRVEYSVNVEFTRYLYIYEVAIKCEGILFELNIMLVQFHY